MRLKERYNKEILPALMKEFGYRNRMQAPRLTKVVLNVGFGRHTKEKAYLDAIEAGLTRIAGQKPVMTRAKKAVSAFKIRQGMVIGAAVTLRGARMYDFLDKLIGVTLPRVRDFRGLSERGVDSLGNLTLGLKEHLAFPEIKAEDVDNIFGLEISVPTTAKSRAEGLALFRLIGFPFKKDEAGGKRRKKAKKKTGK